MRKRRKYFPMKYYFEIINPEVTYTIFILELIWTVKIYELLIKLIIYSCKSVNSQACEFVIYSLTSSNKKYKRRHFVYFFDKGDAGLML